MPADTPDTEAPSDNSVLAPLGAINRAVNEAIGRAMMLDPALHDLLIKIGIALDDVINDLEDFDD